MIANNKLLNIYKEEDRGFLDQILINKEILTIIHPEEKYLGENSGKEGEKFQGGYFKPWFSNYKSISRGLQLKNQIVYPIFNPNFHEEFSEWALGQAPSEESFQKRLYAVCQIEKSTAKDISTVLNLLW